MKVVQIHTHSRKFVHTVVVDLMDVGRHTFSYVLLSRMALNPGGLDGMLPFMGRMLIKNGPQVTIRHKGPGFSALR